MRSIILALTLSAAVLYSVSLFAAEEQPAAAPESIRICAAYGGTVTNKYEKQYHGSTIKLKDTGAMGGLYLQWIEPDMLQGNIFLYGAPDVNYSRVLGGHGNLDGYFLNQSYGSLVAGIDVEDINIDMKAKDNVAGLEDFRMKNNVLFGMLRAGARAKIAPVEEFKITIFPYAGITRENVTGALWVDPPSVYMGPMMGWKNPDATKISIDDSETFASWGVNCTITVFHFVELTGKYLGRAMKDNYQSSYTGQINIYLSRHVAITAQSKYMELSNGSDFYNLLGIAAVF